MRLGLMRRDMSSLRPRPPQDRARSGKTVEPILPILILSIVPLLLVSQATCRTDPATGRVRVLFLGELVGNNEVFTGWIRTDPQFTISVIPCDLQWMTVQEANRFSRMYLPRTEAEVREGYDGLIFSDFTCDVIPNHVIEWFRTSIHEGIGIALVEFVNWFGSNTIEKWMTLKFYDVFPVDVVMNCFPAERGRTFYKIINKDGPLALPGIEEVPMNVGEHGDMIPRPGATTEAVWKGRKTPCMVTSKYGAGVTLQLGHGWDNVPLTQTQYPYLPDYVYNCIFCIASLPYPEDFELVHTVRMLLLSYQDRIKITLSVVDFADMMGANTEKIEEDIDALEARYRDTSLIYFQGDYEKAKDELTDLMKAFSAIEVDLMRAKDRALAWIYAVEWCSVFGVSLLCGSVLWSLMVRKRLYREVGTTRLR